MLQIKALCYKHVDKEASLSNIVREILNSLIKDALLDNFTYSGDSKTKIHKLISYTNVTALFYAVFVFADKKDVNKYLLPTEKAVNKQISAAVVRMLEKWLKKSTM